MITQAKKPNREDRLRDRTLVRRILQGEQQACCEFVNLYKDRLFSSMLAHTGSQHEAEEIVQEAFIKAFQHLSSFQHQSQLYTWVFRIAWNTSVSRARLRRNEVSLEASGADSSASAPESMQPHLPMERLEQIAMLRRALGEIETRHQKILLLREFEEHSYQEIAEIMQIPLGTVRSRLSRARDRLREELINVDEASGGSGRESQQSDAPASTLTGPGFPERAGDRQPTRETAVDTTDFCVAGPNSRRAVRLDTYVSAVDKLT